MSEASTPSFASPSESSSRSSLSPPSTPPNLHQNTMDPSAKWLVQKYGGTSVGKFAVKIAEEIIPSYLDQHRVAIVCSARSGSTKALGTTNILLRAASEALRRNCISPTAPQSPGTSTPPSGYFWGRPQAQDAPNFPSSPVTPGSRARSGSSPRATSPPPSTPLYSSSCSQPFNGTVDLLKSEHITAAKQAVNDPALLKELINEIEHDCEALRAFLHATQVIDEISPRSKDSIVGVGERLACKLVSTILRDRGIDAEYVSLESIVPEGMDDDNQTSKSRDVESLDQTFYDRLSVLLGERIRQCGNRVPVVTGFFGPVPGSLLRQIGRGYTDLLAALLTVGLSACELQIWKEVDGVFTADPRKVPTARLIPFISPDEAAELTYYGSEVVHPFTMEQVIRCKIPIRIKNVQNPVGRGTVIQPESDITDEPPSPDLETLLREGTPLSVLADLASETEERHRRKRLPTAVTIKEHILVINVNSNRKSVSHGFLAGIFGSLDKFGVVVDLISTSEVHVSMAIEDGGLNKKILARLVKELEKSGTVSVHPDMAILSLVGHQMRNMVGIAGRMFSTLADGNINIEMISQGASEINISCVIESRDAAKALNLIHQSCLQIKPEGAQGRVGPWLF
ncbi:aspartate kinase [Hysterangium stoloniferum]|nr:aspartate kinase [Hysterangium stoloniferum]